MSAVTLTNNRVVVEAGVTIPLHVQQAMRQWLVNHGITEPVSTEHSLVRLPTLRRIHYTAIIDEPFPYVARTAALEAAPLPWPDELLAWAAEVEAAA